METIDEIRENEIADAVFVMAQALQDEVPDESLIKAANFTFDAMGLNKTMTPVIGGFIVEQKPYHSPKR